MLVNLNYRIGVHMNFAQLRIPALVCSLQSEYDCHQARNLRGGNGAMPPQFQSFQVNKIFEVETKEILQCKSTKQPQGTYPTSAFSRTQTCFCTVLELHA